MIDFTSCPVNKFKGYGGANGNKINILYEDQSYMLKFPPVPNKSKVILLERKQKILDYSIALLLQQELKM